MKRSMIYLIAGYFSSGLIAACSTSLITGKLMGYYLFNPLLSLFWISVGILILVVSITGFKEHQRREYEEAVREYEEAAKKGARAAEDWIRKIYKEAEEKFEKWEKENEKKKREFKEILKKKGIDHKSLIYLPATLQIGRITLVGVIEYFLGSLVFLHRLEDGKTIGGLILKFREVEITSEEPLKLKFIGEGLGGHIYHPWDWDFGEVSKALRNVGL
jgi:uncharacterized membrane protein